MAAKGKEVYKANCTACHKFKKRYIGPALKGITQRRSPEWIMNMVMNTTEMLAKDPVAKALIAEYNAPMAQQSLKEDEVRAIVEYFRTKN
jgi:mono/diheme cytochrome c family protein